MSTPIMPNCTCASARAATLSALSGFTSSSAPTATAVPPSAGASAAPTKSVPVPDTDSLLRQAEEATDTLSTVRDYLRLLGDCIGANTGNKTPTGTESLAVALRDQTEHLTLAGTQIDALTLVAWTVAPGTTLGSDIESQGTIVYTLRHLLGALYDALGHYSRSHQDITVNAYADTMCRIADRLDAVEKSLLDLVFAPTPAHPVPPPTGPSLSADLAKDHAATCRIKRAPKREAVCA